MSNYKLTQRQRSTEAGADSYGNPQSSEFDRGYQDGLTGRGYRPSSVAYANGFQSGELAATRLGWKKDARTGGVDGY